MAATDNAGSRKLTVWAGLEALGRSRPHLLLDGDSPNTYVARWQNSPVPAHVLAGRIRRALPGATILQTRSWPGRSAIRRPTQNTQTGGRETRQSITIEFAVETDAPAPSDSTEGSEPRPGA